MRGFFTWAALNFGLLPIPEAAPPPFPAAKLQPGHVTVTIPSGTIVGSATESIEIFNGIPFADPPTGSLRFKPPIKLSTHLGTFDATGVAKVCPQDPIPGSPSSSTIQKQDTAKNVLSNSSSIDKNDGVESPDQSEDCLTVTVHRPRGIQAGADLPVLFYIFGGGFIIGSTSDPVNDPTKLVQTGIDLGQPFIFVAVNYRLGGWGFMPGAEILHDGSANAGLLDQRMGLEWVADNVAAFGGDPDKVTIWGHSAGAISVFHQLVLHDGNATYNDKPLFRAAMMNSGSVTPTDAIDSPKAQALYNLVVEEAGCQGDDSLDCLRGLEFEALAKAIAAPNLLAYQGLALTYLPRPDGKVLSASPHVLAKRGKFHAVPMILSIQEDEGVAFSLVMSDMGTTDKIVDYLAKVYYHDADRSLITAFVDTFSTRFEDGSPYRTGTLLKSLFYPGQKRIASIIGDAFFTLIRRWTLETVSTICPEVPLWSSFASYNYRKDHLGTLRGTQHGVDTSVFFGEDNDYYPTMSGRQYYINFVHHMDPNVGVEPDVFWPMWLEGRQLLWYNACSNGLLDDDFRSGSYDFMKEHIDVLLF